MPTGDHLRQLFRGYSRRDDEMFRAAAESLIDDERLKNHRLLAEDLERLLRNGSRNAGTTADRLSVEPPRDKERGLALVDVSYPETDWSRLIAPPIVTDELRRVVSENASRERLAAYGLRPSNRMLFFGPPGCGKTLAASVIAASLGVPLATVRFDSLVSSYLGETASNLRKVFDFVSRGTWVVLFDEFDAIGKDRDNTSEHGELKRVVNALLQMMDSFSGNSVLVAATNHQSLLDTAVWRRFHAVIRFDPPTQQDRVLLLRLFLRGMAKSDIDLVAFARKLPRSTGSDLELIAIDAARRAVLDGRTNVSDADMGQALRIHRLRSEAIRQAVGTSAGQTNSEALG
jgi:SpoVK/Ycf46/Vps4 family AAA+-type ATPase